MLNYEIKGKGDPIVLIHGYLESMMMWKSIAKELSKDYTVIKVDLPGHGFSPNVAEVHTMEILAREVNRVLDKEEVSNALVIGHSMGGYVTLALADLFPKKVGAFVLMNSTTRQDTAEKKELRLRAVETAKTDFDALVKMSIPLLFNENNLDNLKDEMKFARNMARKTQLMGVLSALKGMRARVDRSYLPKQFQGKIGVIIGEFDRTVPQEGLMAAIEENSENENISVLKLPIGHMAYLEAPDETLDFLKTFAKSVSEKAEASE